jgi:methyl-accepting chemotaxis protein
VNTAGVGFDSNNVPVNLSAREYVQKALTGENAVSDPVISPATGALVAVFASPVKGDDGKVSGVFFGSIDLGDVAQKAAEVKVGKTGYAYILKGDGLTIATTEQRPRHEG